MTMTLDTTQQRFGHALNFDYSAHSQPPAFSNPWSSSSPAQSAPASSGLFVGSQPPAPLSHSMMASKAPNARTSASSTSSLSSYGSLPIAAPSSAAGTVSHCSCWRSKTDIPSRNPLHEPHAYNIGSLRRSRLCHISLACQRPLCTRVRFVRSPGLCLSTRATGNVWRGSRCRPNQEILSGVSSSKSKPATMDQL
jgi:hypothetical protein